MVGSGRNMTPLAAYVQRHGGAGLGGLGRLDGLRGLRGMGLGGGADNPDAAAQDAKLRELARRQRQQAADQAQKARLKAANLPSALQQHNERKGEREAALKIEAAASRRAAARRRAARGARTKRQKRFRKEVASIMYGFGDAWNPLKESVDLLEKLSVEYIHRLTHRAAEVAAVRGKLDTESFVFLIRKDPKKMGRVRELLKMFEEINTVRNNVTLDKRTDDELKMTGAGARGAFTGSAAEKAKRKRLLAEMLDEDYDDDDDGGAGAGSSAKKAKQQ